MKKNLIKVLALSLTLVMALGVLAGCGAKKEVKLQILDTEYTVEEYAICVAKGNDDLLADLNKAIDELIADGTVDGIIAKYIK